MKASLKLKFLMVTVFLVAVVWALLGREWRALILTLPTDDKVLSWNHQQRSAGFRMLDRIPLLVQSRRIVAEESVRELPLGEALNLDMDFGAYFSEQHHAAMVILHGGKVRLEHYGLGFTPTQRWTSFSGAKSFTSTLVGAAIKDGAIESLEESVSKDIPELADTPYHEVSIRQLLTMSSGVAWNEDYEDPLSDVAQFNLHKPEPGLPALVSYFQTAQRAHPPGQVWNYSTGETNLIGVLLAAATGRQLSDYLQEKIWQPAGMEADATWLLGSDGAEISGCCMQARTRDFARFGLFLLTGAKNQSGKSILPDGWLEQATRSQADTHYEGEGYGFQWWTYDDGSYAARGIFGQGIFIDPKRQLVIASNSSWTSAMGEKDGERQRREAFYRAVQVVVDAESRD